MSLDREGKRKATPDMGEKIQTKRPEIASLGLRKYRSKREGWRVSEQTQQTGYQGRTIAVPKGSFADYTNPMKEASLCGEDKAFPEPQAPAETEAG